MTSAVDLARQTAEGDVGSRLVERLVTLVGGSAGSRTIFGEPVERDGVTVITVARVRWGVGGGGGGGTGAEGSGSGSGGGGGAWAEPVGYIEITPAGATYHAIPRPLGPAPIIGAAVGIAIVLRGIARLRR